METILVFSNDPQMPNVSCVELDSNVSGLGIRDKAFNFGIFSTRTGGGEINNNKQEKNLTNKKSIAVQIYYD